MFRYYCCVSCNLLFEGFQGTNRNSEKNFSTLMFRFRMFLSDMTLPYRWDLTCNTTMGSHPFRSKTERNWETVGVALIINVVRERTDKAAWRTTRSVESAVCRFSTNHRISPEYFRFVSTYLVARSWCTKSISSRYFMPEAICVAMYNRVPKLKQKSCGTLNLFGLC